MPPLPPSFFELIERIAREYTGRLLTVKINVDRQPAVAARYEVLVRLQGAQPYEAIRRAIADHWPAGA